MKYNIIPHCGPQRGSLYELTCDINVPIYKTTDAKYPSYFSIQNNSRFEINWYHLYEKDILFHIDVGANLGKLVNYQRIAQLRIDRSYTIAHVDKIEYVFLYKEKIITIVLAETDWGRLIIPCGKDIK
jgi:hypothetical protein